MADREITVVVPVEVRLTLHDDEETTLQWVDLDDDTDPVAYDVDSAEQIKYPLSGLVALAAETAVLTLIGPARRV